jgi:hypothetical protein
MDDDSAQSVLLRMQEARSAALRRFSLWAGVGGCAWYVGFLTLALFLSTIKNSVANESVALCMLVAVFGSAAFLAGLVAAVVGVIRKEGRKPMFRVLCINVFASVVAGFGVWFVKSFFYG